MTDLLNLFRALADPTRLRIACLIRQMELSVGEVVQILAQSQPRISRHVRILAEARLVERRKEGAWVFLRPGPLLADGGLGTLLDRESDSEIYAADALSLQKVRRDRAEAARRWFADHAGEWDDLRALYIAEEEVEAAMSDILGNAGIGLLVDIGTGTGRMVELFSGRANQTIAVDNSPEMLRIARAKLTGDSANDVANLDLRLAGFDALPLEDGVADLAIMHQVLHYASEPAPVVAEAARVLAPGGRLLIADFAPHEVEELRANHAHARLGFSDESMAGWFDEAGLDPVGERFLDGGRLTVRLWLGRKRDQIDTITRPDGAPNRKAA